ncbi:hypothetical protein OIU78_024109 [Salix suchowensis]|nr:hypothetical protein OIU78_024109 [Salix suchowensis]
MDITLLRLQERAGERNVRKTINFSSEKIGLLNSKFVLYSFSSQAAIGLVFTRDNVILIAPSDKNKTKKTDRLDTLFDSYANCSSGIIDPEGIEALCSDINVEHTDVRILMFAWKLKAQRQGYFTRDEWRKLEKEVNTPGNFQDFYSYAFRYCLTEEKQKTVDIESVCELLNLVLGSQFQSKVDLLIEYLKIQSDYKAINLDQWMGFLRFCKEISFPRS